MFDVWDLLFEAIVPHAAVEALHNAFPKGGAGAMECHLTLR
jgi:hypothetical protein